MRWISRFRRRLHYWRRSFPWQWGDRPVVPVTAMIAVGVITLRLWGFLQPLELITLDQLFCLQPLQPVDERILIVGIDDIDINQVQTWPIPDQILADALQRIVAAKPRVIGLDIYRDLPVEPGHTQLNRLFSTTPQLIGIEKLADNEAEGVRPPPILAERKQIGFNNVVVDLDKIVRRMLLFWQVNGVAHKSLALTLATRYLASEGIEPMAAPDNPSLMQLGRGVFPRLHPDDGGYRGADTGGYQVLAAIKGPYQTFHTVSLRAVLDGEVPAEQIRDRIVLVGSTASSLRDFFYTAQSGRFQGNARSIPGVEIHASFVSQILAAATQGRSLIRVWPEPLEMLWIVGWSWLGALLSWRVRSPGRAVLGIALLGVGLLAIASLALGQWDYWIPLTPAALALVGAAFAITGYLANREAELTKSKEFLNSVINTIPDPVFVKDRKHRWIVLNAAYCRLLGKPLQTLLDKTDHDFLPQWQADLIWKQDALIFATGTEQESEEEFTNSRGVTYHIATKRSLHRDAAGNVFLVGVIRDITQRKQVEEELRRTAAELVRSNTELRQAEDRLRHMAYYDTLTGLPNRELLSDRLEQALIMAREHDQLLAVLFLDLDGFKQINDSYGHQMGNLLLRAVAQRLLRCLRSSDTVARLGGDEFVVLLPSISHSQDVGRVAEKILQTLCQSYALEGQSLQVTTSIGISLYTQASSDADTLLKQADLAMYHAKKLGKNQYQLFSPSLNPAESHQPESRQPESHQPDLPTGLPAELPTGLPTGLPSELP
ncbi:MAG TPA: CHASE2 domain-containing protein [Chroococcidiopsis sp.]